MLASSIEKIEELVGPDDLVLDIGGWAKPFGRADWVVDLMPYETRGGQDGDPRRERFDRSTWVQTDICDREPLPFEDRQFDFAVCSHTLEDIRDPVWVCSEMQRVASAGYIEVPSRFEEQRYGVHGPWVGWSHHRWLCDVREGEIEFVHKPHLLAGVPGAHFPQRFGARLAESDRVQCLFWEGTFTARERIFLEAEGLDSYLADFVAAGIERFGAPGGGVRERIVGRVDPLLNRIRAR